MEPDEKEASSRTTGTASASGLRNNMGRFVFWTIIGLGIFFLILFVKIRLPPPSEEQIALPPQKGEVQQRSHCPDPQGYWVGNSTVRIDTAAGCGFLFQRADAGPDLRIWINGDRTTAKRWVASNDPAKAPHFDEVTRFAEVELWDEGAEEVYTAFTFPSK